MTQEQRLIFQDFIMNKKDVLKGLKQDLSYSAVTRREKLMLTIEINNYTNFLRDTEQLFHKLKELQ